MIVSFLQKENWGLILIEKSQVQNTRSNDSIYSGGHEFISICSKRLTKFPFKVLEDINCPTLMILLLRGCTLK